MPRSRVTRIGVRAAPSCTTAPGVRLQGASSEQSRSTASRASASQASGSSGSARTERHRDRVARADRAHDPLAFGERSPRTSPEPRRRSRARRVDHLPQKELQARAVQGRELRPAEPVAGRAASRRSSRSSSAAAQRGQTVRRADPALRSARLDRSAARLGAGDRCAPRAPRCPQLRGQPPPAAAAADDQDPGHGGRSYQAAPRELRTAASPGPLGMGLIRPETPEIQEA